MSGAESLQSLKNSNDLQIHKFIREGIPVAGKVIQKYLYNQQQSRENKIEIKSVVYGSATCTQHDLKQLLWFE